jgi:hypothetical protein
VAVAHLYLQKINNRQSVLIKFFKEDVLKPKRLHDSSSFLPLRETESINEINFFLSLHHRWNMPASGQKHVHSFESVVASKHADTTTAAAESMLSKLFTTFIGSFLIVCVPLSLWLFSVVAGCGQEMKFLFQNI